MRKLVIEFEILKNSNTLISLEILENIFQKSETKHILPKTPSKSEV